MQTACKSVNPGYYWIVGHGGENVVKFAADLRTSLKLQSLNTKAHRLLSDVLLRQGKIEDSKKESSIAAKYSK